MAKTGEYRFHSVDPTLNNTTGVENKGVLTIIKETDEAELITARKLGHTINVVYTRGIRSNDKPIARYAIGQSTTDDGEIIPHPNMESGKRFTEQFNNTAERIRTGK